MNTKDIFVTGWIESTGSNYVVISNWVSEEFKAEHNKPLISRRKEFSNKLEALDYLYDLRFSSKE